MQPAIGRAQTPRRIRHRLTAGVQSGSDRNDAAAGLDLKLEQIPAPVQTAVSADIEASGALDLSDFLNRRFNGVFVNEMQGNPFQPDLNYRGYTASPLLGTPQGLSIYMDGVRLNQPFGDVVSWDLIPRMAIAIDDAHAGLESAVRTQHAGRRAVDPDEGRPQHPGTSVRAIYGSDVRRAVEFEHGGSRASGLHWYLAGNLFGEDGWRDDSPSRRRPALRQAGLARRETRHGALGRLRRQLAERQRPPGAALSGSRLRERLHEAGRDRQPLDLRQPDDETRPEPDADAVSGNVYYRHIRTNTFNGDINEDSLDQAMYQPNAAEQAALAAAGYTGFPTSGATAANTPFPFWRCIGNVLLNDEPGEKCNGLLNRTTTQHNYGASGQLTWRDRLRGATRSRSVAATTAAARHSSSRPSWAI